MAGLGFANTLNYGKADRLKPSLDIDNLQIASSEYITQWEGLYFNTFWIIISKFFFCRLFKFYFFVA